MTATNEARPARWFHGCTSALAACASASGAYKTVPMPIYEYYCPDNHTIYQFYAKTMAQGATTPPCPDNSKFRLKKILSAFAITGGGSGEEAAETKSADPAASAEDRRMEAAMDSMEREFSSMDENNPKEMARMMRRMAEVSGEKMDGQLEEVVRKLEEGADPDSLEDALGPDLPNEDSGDPESGGMGLDADSPPMLGEAAKKEARHRFKARRTAPRRDPKLYDYP
ncbi:MAG: FmdB family transcriptional regulator [Opitutaceae bacterium]|nr:FmdB family transcriptional regulator [Opitutaceae bacterium]